MDYKKKANKIRTNLLLKISSEISRFKNSKTLINSKLPSELYDIYNHIKIIIENQYEFSTVKRSEFLRKFSDSNLTKYDNVNETGTPYMEIFKQINKIIISEKKNQNFLNNLNKGNNDSKETSISPFEKNIKKNNNKLINENDHHREDDVVNRHCEVRREARCPHQYPADSEHLLQKQSAS